MTEQKDQGVGAQGRERTLLAWARPRGVDFETMRRNVWETGLADKGDTILVWVNEGDFWHLTFSGVQLEEYKSSEGVAGSEHAVNRAGKSHIPAVDAVQMGSVAHSPSEAPFFECPGCGKDCAEPDQPHDPSCPRSGQMMGNELARLVEELEAFHDCADGDVAAGNGHFRVECISGSDQQRLNLRAVLRDAATVIRGFSPAPSPGETSDDAGDAATLRGFINEHGVTPSMVASERDILRAQVEQMRSTVTPEAIEAALSLIRNQLAMTSDRTLLAHPSTSRAQGGVSDSVSPQECDHG